MDNITERTNYLNIELVDDVAQYDMGSFDFDGYDFGQCAFYRVKKNEECRPDIISYRIYGTQNYWWFLCSFNNFMDPWNDIVENQIIRYPAIQRVRDFLKERRKKAKDNRDVKKEI